MFLLLLGGCGAGAAGPDERSAHLQHWPSTLWQYPRKYSLYLIIVLLYYWLSSWWTHLWRRSFRSMGIRGFFGIFWDEPSRCVGLMFRNSRRGCVMFCYLRVWLVKCRLWFWGLMIVWKFVGLSFVLMALMFGVYWMSICFQLPVWNSIMFHVIFNFLTFHKSTESWWFCIIISVFSRLTTWIIYRNHYIRCL